MKKLFYIGRRDNPQLQKPYFVAYGQLTKKDAAKMEQSLYGSMSLTPYDNEQDFMAKIEELTSTGYSVKTR